MATNAGRRPSRTPVQKNEPGRRDLGREHTDNERRYSYDFDTILRRYMLRAFASLLSGRKRVLELGCFMGDMTELLAAQFGHVTVVEGAKDLALQVKARLGKRVTVHHSFFEDVELTETFDAVFLVHTLEHLDQPVEVLKRCQRWLAPDGLLFVVVPNANAPSRQLAVKMGVVEHNAAVTPAEFKHGHRRTYALDTLERDASAAGLRIENRGGVFFKALANFQFDKLLAMAEPVIDERYLDACFALGMQYPDLCASVFVVCSRPGKK